MHLWTNQDQSNNFRINSDEVNAYSFSSNSCQSSSRWKEQTNQILISSAKPVRTTLINSNIWDTPPYIQTHSGVLPGPCFTLSANTNCRITCGTSPHSQRLTAQLSASSRKVVTFNKSAAFYHSRKSACFYFWKPQFVFFFLIWSTKVHGIFSQQHLCKLFLLSYGISF